jgi:hypothetical protein
MSENGNILHPDVEAIAVLDELSEPLTRRIYGPMAQAGYEAPSPVLTKRPGVLEVRYSDRGTTLTAAHYLHDPIIAQDRGLARAPEAERQKLQSLEEHGVAPDLVWVLREMPGTWQPGQLPPRMIGVVGAETARTRHMQHLQAGAAAFAVGRALLYTAGAACALALGSVVALGAITVAGLGAAPAIAPLARGLDPIILGGVVHRESGAVAWVPLAAWDEIPDTRAW